jgi:hypothetical protein
MADAIKTDETLPDVPAKVVKEAQLDGIKEAISESAKSRFLSTDGIPEGEDVRTIRPTYDVFQLQHLVDLDPVALKDRLNSKDDFVLTEGQVAGLLEVERSGKNRTDIVKVLCDHLGIDSPYEVTNAGPNYTNDVARSMVKPRD